MEYLVIVGGGEARWTSQAAVWWIRLFSFSPLYENIDIRHVDGASWEMLRTRQTHPFCCFASFLLSSNAARHKGCTFFLVFFQSAQASRSPTQASLTGPYMCKFWASCVIDCLNCKSNQSVCNALSQRFPNGLEAGFVTTIHYYCNKPPNNKLLNYTS